MRKNKETPNRHDAMQSLAAEVHLIPKRSATELISLPRAEYEYLIRTEENFSRICNLLKDNSLSPYTIGEVIKVMFPEQAAVEKEPEPDAEQPEREGADA